MTGNDSRGVPGGDNPLAHEHPRRGTDARLDRPSGSSIFPQVVGILIAMSLILVIVAAISLRGRAGVEPQRPILLATGEWSPYSGEGLVDFGVATAVVTAVFKQMGYEPEFRFMPWPRAEMAALEEQASDGVRGAFPYTYNEERSRNFYYSTSILDIELSVFFNAERFPGGAAIGAPADLADFPVVRISGYRYPAEVERHFADLPPMQDNVAALNLLLESELPLVVIEATRVGEQLLRETLASRAEAIGSARLHVSNPLHLIATKGNPENHSLIRRFDATLRQMRRDGTIEAIETRTLEAIDSQRMVLLQPLDSRGHIDAYLDMQANSTLRLPRGTKAIVERWSSDFLRARRDDADSTEMVRIRVLNGPQRGRTLYVDGGTIVLP